MTDNFKRDATPLETDWEDLRALFADMQAFAKEHPRHVFISADDPGIHYNPWRVPRMGWTAFIPHPIGLRDGEYFDEEPKVWTITLPWVKTWLNESPQDEWLLTAIETARGRQGLLAVLGLLVGS